MLNLSDHPHRRYNPLADEWVVVSPHRTQRPWQGQVEAASSVESPAYDPTCYLCPGNERAGGRRNPAYSGTFVFDNDFAALLPDVPAGRLDSGGLVRAESLRGICRVLCFSPRHDLRMSLLSREEIHSVVDAWADQTLDLGAQPFINYVQIFENRGEMMGASNPHPHGQIWGLEVSPGLVAREHASQQHYFLANGRSLLSDYLTLELADGSRIVCANEHFVALVPFWAVWPFETMLISRRHIPSLPDLDPAEREGLADILKRVTSRYDAMFGVPFPYSMGFHQQPTDGNQHAGWHLHAHFLPPLLRSATVRKFMVGFELLGEPQRDITAEKAAEVLRSLPEH